MAVSPESKVRFLIQLFCAVLISGCATLSPEKSEPDSAVKLTEKDASEFIRAGDKAYSQGDLDAALVQYILALESDAQNPNTFYKVGKVHRLRNDLDLAEKSLAHAIRLSPEHIESREELGLVILRKENYQYARALLERVVETDATRWRSLNALGVLHDLQEEYDLAREYFQKAIAVKPKSAQILNNLGYSYYLQRNWEKAELYFRQAVQSSPNYGPGWSNLALVYLQKGEHEQARLAFEKTVSDHQALNNIGYFEFLRNNPIEARKHLREALHTAPSYYPTAQRNLDSLSSEQGSLGNENIVLNVPNNYQTSNENDARQRTSTPQSLASGIEASTGKSTLDSPTISTNVSGEISEETVVAVQEKLTILGYDPGPVDGVAGNKTLRAIRRFQRDKGIRVNGVINDALLNQL